MSSDAIRRTTGGQVPGAAPAPQVESVSPAGGLSQRVGGEAATPATPTTLQDGVDAPPATVTLGGTTASERAATGLDSDVERLRRENAELNRRLSGLEEAADAREAQEADEARKPGFFRALLEIFEFIGRFFSPIVNAISLAFRALRICYMLLAGKEIDWKKEGLRAAGDLLGIFFPPAGAIINTGLNLWFNESELLGGVNQMWDQAEVENPFRRGAVTAWNGARDAFGRIRDNFSDNVVEPGSENDDGMRPLVPQEVVI